MGSKIRVAIVGAGGWGGHHARILSQHPDVELVAIMGRTPDKTKKRADEYRARAYTDLHQMLQTEKPDLVSICLPNLQHFDATLQVIRAGYPLLVEKPLVFDLGEADTLLKEAADRSLFFAINFNHRYGKPIRMARQAIADGRLGQPVFAWWRFGGEGYQDHPFGNLIETQCHGFDQLEYLCGPIRSVMAQMRDRTGNSFTTLAIALEFASGAVGAMIGSYDSSYAYPGTHLLEINGVKGRILVEDTVRRYSFQAVGNETAEVWQAGYFNDFDREFQRTFDVHLNEIIQAFKAGLPPPVHASAGRRALQLAHAAIESFQTGRRVEVP